MSSGLIAPEGPEDWNAEFLQSLNEGGMAGGGSLSESLAHPLVGTEKEFSYLGVNNIMKYVVSRGRGCSLPNLSMNDAVIGWIKSSNGV